jgi:predicted ABC-type ATPase
VKRKHWFILVGGINGAGKTTLAQSRPFLESLGLPAAAPLEIINPDLVTSRLREQAPEAPIDEINLRAARICEARVRAALKESASSVVIETVLSTDKYKSIFRLAKRNGYDRLFIYIVLPSIAEAIARVRHRVRKGGHAVPARKIRKRWPRSRANVAWFWQQADRAVLMLNGRRGPGSLPTLMAWKDTKDVWYQERDTASSLLSGAPARRRRPTR